MKSAMSLQNASFGRTALVLRRAHSDPLLTAFLALACALTVFHGYSLMMDPSLRVLAAGLVSATALLPSYIWCRQRGSGLPIFPLFALTFVAKYAYHLAGDDPLIVIYGDEAGLEAGLLVSAFLLIGTAAWYSFQRLVPMARGPLRAMAPGRGDAFFSVLICLAAILVFGMVGAWYRTEGGIYPIVRAALTGLSSVGIFVIAYRWGAGELDGTKKAFFCASLLLYFIAYSMSLFLIDLIAGTAFAVAAYVIGGGRVPWKLTLAMLGLFTMLHAGKGDMRTEYWGEQYKTVQIYEYPSFITKYIEYGWEALNSPSDPGDMSLSERMSLVPLLLKVQAESPDKRPYLLGETYGIIPALLVPRLLNPAKPNAHDGTRMLSVHYGLTWEDTDTTTIAWGPLNEAYANFGTLGVIVLAILIGATHGGIQKWASGAPMLSLRNLVAVVFAALALQVEWTAAVYVSALFQSLVVVWAMSFVLMEHRLPSGKPA